MNDTPLIILDIQEVFEGSGGGGLPDYKGEYEITPTIEDQTLPTKNRSLREDIVVKKIPTYEVSNEYGTTFIIGTTEERRKP